MARLPPFVLMWVEIATFLILRIDSSPGIRALTQTPQDEHSEIIDWLNRFGYLPPQDSVTGQLQTWEAVTNAIISMQRFAGIPETGIVDEATLNLTQIPRCSLPDLRPEKSTRKRRNDGSVWKKKYITWRIQSYPTDLSLGRETIRALMFYGLKIWSEKAPLHFHEVLGERADILIGFPTGEHGDGYPFDGRGGMLAHAFFPGDHLLAGTVHFDGDETWTFRSPADQGTDLFSVTVHEFGHVLGLAHSASRNSIMHPYYQGAVGDPLKYQLHADDRSEIEHLYGSRDSPNHKGQEPGIKPSRIPSRPEASRRPPTFSPGSHGPDRCRTTFDAAAQIRGETFLFKGQFFWRLSHSGLLASVRPARISRFWRGLPGGFGHLDAVYERIADHKIIFFTGNNYWVFTGNGLEGGSPKPIADFGLPAGGIDAAFSWAQDKKTYFFKGVRVWRYDEEEQRLDPGYPSEARPWRDLPDHIDDAMGWTDGSVFFLSGLDCWKYSADGLVLSPGFPRGLGSLWMGCEETGEAGDHIVTETGASEAGTSLRGDGPGSRGETCVCGRGVSERSPSLASGLRLLLLVFTQCLPAAIIV